MILSKKRPLTEKEELNIAFPDLKDITCEIHSDVSGHIIYIKTEEQKIIEWAKTKGFVK